MDSNRLRWRGSGLTGISSGTILTGPVPWMQGRSRGFLRHRTGSEDEADPAPERCYAGGGGGGPEIMIFTPPPKFPVNSLYVLVYWMPGYSG